MNLGDSNNAIAFSVTIIDIIDGGKFVATIADSSKIMIQLPHGVVKIHAGDDYITGHFSSAKREVEDVHGRCRVWRECSFGEVVIPETGVRSVIGIEGVRYEIHIIMSMASSDKQEDIHVSRGDMFFRLPHIDIIERFSAHICAADCMRGCSGGAWIRVV